MVDPQDASKRKKILTGWAHHVLNGVERRLEGSDWIASDEFSVADFLLSCVLREVRKTSLMENYPRVERFYHRAIGRLGWQRTLQLYAERLGVNAEEIK